MLNFFNRKKADRIIISIRSGGDGKIRANTKLGDNISVQDAIVVLDNIRNDLQTRLVVKAQNAGYTSKNPKSRGYLKSIRVKDLR